MEEIRIDGQGLQLLQQNLGHSMQELKRLIIEIQSNDDLLRSALGENDCQAFQKRVVAMQEEYVDAEKDIVSMLEYLEEYTNRVGEIRLLVNPDGTLATQSE